MRDWILTEVEARNIQRLMHLLAPQTHVAEYQLGAAAIQILIAESAGASANRLEKSTKRLLLATYILVALTLLLAVLTIALLQQ